jgi:hypothetical protein
MSNYSVHLTIRALALGLLLLPVTSAWAQTPSPTPLPTPDPQATPIDEPRQPTFPATQQGAAVPPPPDLTRVGVISSNVLALSLNDAIRRALQEIPNERPADTEAHHHELVDAEMIHQ